VDNTCVNDVAVDLMANMVSTREAAQIVSVLLATPFQQRAEQWPSLLTLLARWAAQAGEAMCLCDLFLLRCQDCDPAARRHCLLLVVNVDVAGVITAPKRPLKPWELKQQQQQPQQQQQQQQESKQKLLQQAAAAVQCALQETAQQALCDAQGPAGSLLARLFVPAVLFVSAALPVVGASAGGCARSTHCAH
jgi:hypothetical protein